MVELRSEGWASPPVACFEYYMRREGEAGMRGGGCNDLSVVLFPLWEGWMDGCCAVTPVHKSHPACCVRVE